MIEFAGRPVRRGLLVAALLGSAVAPGCAGRGRSYTSAPESRVSRVVQRPALGPAGEKNVYVGGYAGADYSRAARGR